MSIKNHKWYDTGKPKVLSINQEAICLGVKNLPWVAISKDDVIAMAKHFELTGVDIDCPVLKRKQGEIDSVDESHFDEVAELEARIKELKLRIGS